MRWIDLNNTLINLDHLILVWTSEVADINPKPYRLHLIFRDRTEDVVVHYEEQETRNNLFLALKEALKPGMMNRL